MFCYLCGQEIGEGQPFNRDHVPPLRFFAKKIRQQYSPQLNTLPTHVECNKAYQKDEEYFVTVMAGHHFTWTAKAVWEDIKRGAQRGKGWGLTKLILSKFGKVIGADGSRLFEMDANRTHRVVWKIVRGLYTLETGRFLPQDSFCNIEIVPHSEAPQVLPNHLWFHIVAGTAGMGRHQAIFDYKWLGTFVDDGHVNIRDSRGNLMAILVWDNLTLLCLFHDPVCRCHRCVAEAAAAGGN